MKVKTKIELEVDDKHYVQIKRALNYDFIALKVYNTITKKMKSKIFLTPFDAIDIAKQLLNTACECLDKLKE